MSLRTTFFGGWTRVTPIMEQMICLEELISAGEPTLPGDRTQGQRSGRLEERQGVLEMQDLALVAVERGDEPPDALDEGGLLGRDGFDTMNDGGSRVARVDLPPAGIAGGFGLKAQAALALFAVHPGGQAARVLGERLPLGEQGLIVAQALALARQLDSGLVDAGLEKLEAIPDLKRAARRAHGRLGRVRLYGHERREQCDYCGRLSRHSGLL